MDPLNKLSENQSSTVQLDSVTQELMVIPIIKEEVVLDKQVIENGKVSVSKKILEEDFNTIMPVIHEEVIIERIQLDIFIEGVPPITRVEGETTIIPIFKEVYVKRLLLVEELHITKQKTINNININEKIRRNEVTVERHDNSLT